MDGEPLEPLGIDDRSGGEKMVAVGRVGVNRINEIVDEQRLDIAALIWMLSTAAFVGVQIYQAWQLFGAGIDATTWDRIAALGQTAGPLVAISSLIGIALAITADSAIARFSVVVAGVLGIWVFIAGIFTFASNVHQRSNDLISFTRGNRAAGAIGGLAFAGFGLVTLMIAWRAGGPSDYEPEPGIS